ncbi:phage tail tape measure protein [Pelosinus propionicus]|uniref:Phage tail tape measure protein, TP901 family, core region n=1 Tax=Pelosinus propionicus DSM 13327 TaxID=1123291 RepID=A0A1I4JGQ7_9FIRM|nr:phage tail tape measure protein [Pelosinus propionicus]SFL65750.1 phage tail tape measure protein, TP901 family, core region [Pelosinus propionicus DSM 13327]
MENMNNVISTRIVVDVKQALAEIQQLKTALNGIRNQSEASGSSKLSQGYVQQINQMTLAAQRLHQQWQTTGSTTALSQYQALIPKIQTLNAQYQNFNRSLGLAGNSLSSFGQSLKSHLGFIGTSLAIGGVIGAVHALTSLETEFHNLATVIPSMHENTTNFNGVMEDSFHLAERYGQKIEEVTESLRLMGRGYKDLSTVEKLSEISMKLAVADNFSAEQATRAIESTVAAYGKQANAIQFAEHVMDSMTAVSHTGMISANDLSAALQRSASAAHTVGVSYEELTAMIGSISRSTALSGSTIGMGIKSILNSIHSDKAIGELDKMGVAVYQIGTNGEKEFRKISDVLLDVSLKSKVAGKDVETAFRSLAGGKFQVSKLSALLGDPQEYIRLMGVAVNSAGFTNKQLEIQLNTISRKFTTLKTQFEELIVIGGQNSGLTSGIKDLLDVINQVIKGFNNLDPSISAITGSTTKWLIGLMALKSSVGFLVNTYTILRTTIVSATTAQTALNVATAANPWGAFARVVLIAASALSTYAFFSGSALEAQDKLSQAQEDAITQKQSQISQIGQQVQFMSTLGKTYAQLQDQLVEYADDEAKVTEIKKTMKTVVEQLTAIIGKEATDRVLASDDIQAALKEEMKIHGNKTTAIQTELDNLSAAQKANAQNTIDMSNARIEAMTNEANESIKCINAIGEALGGLSKMKYQYYQGKADLMNSTAEMLQSAEAEDLPWYAQLGYQQMAQDTGIYSSDQAKEEAQAAQAQADAIRQEAIDKENARKAKAQGVIVPELTKGIDTGRSTGTVDTDEGTKKKGKGIASPKMPDSSNEVFRLEVGREVAAMFSEQKVAGDRYEQTLDFLNTQSSILGKTEERNNAILKLKNERTLDLLATSMEYTDQANEYQRTIDITIAGNSELQEQLKNLGVLWSSLTKEEQKEFLAKNKGYVEDEKNISKLMGLVDKLREHAASASKEASKLGTSVITDTKANKADAYSKSMANVESDSTLAIAELGYNPDILAKKQEELRAVTEKLYLAKLRLKELEDEPSTTVEDLQKQKIAVQELTNEVSKAMNVDKDKIVNSFVDVLDSLLLEGEKFNNIWKKLWRSLAVDALRDIATHGKSQPTSLLGQLLNAQKSITQAPSAGSGSNVRTNTSSALFPSNKDWLGMAASVYGTSATQKTSTDNTDKPKTTDYLGLIGQFSKLFKFADGGVVSKPTNALIGETGEKEAVINLGKLQRGDKRQKGLLAYANQHQGTHVTANVSQRTMDTAQQISQNAAVSREHVTELQKSNVLMQKQLQVMTYMANQSGNSKGTVTQPIIMPQAQSDEALFAQMQRMKANGYT